MTIININKDSSYEEDVLCCPECKFEFNHIVKTGTIKPKDLDPYELSKEPYSFLPIYPRGSTAYTIFECEGGHFWYIAFSFHKGRVFVESKTIKNGIEIFGKYGKELLRT
jgi:hypothetical protein